MTKYTVYKFDTPDHIVSVEEAPQYWEDHLFAPIQTVADGMNPNDQLVIMERQQAIGIAIVEATDAAVKLLQENGYTVIEIK